MKNRKTPLSKLKVVLLLATLVMLIAGSVLSTKAVLTYFSEDYISDFELDHLQVHLIENGVDVCHNKNDDDTVHSTYTNKKKYKGNLVEYLGYTNKEHYKDVAGYKIGTPGRVEPGKTYKEEISAKNGQNINQYVRLTVRKYWVKDGKKNTKLSPSMIKLTYNGSAYNKAAWQKNTKEHTEESDTYYLSKMLPKKKASDLLFNELTIDGSVADKAHMTKHEKKEGNKTVITYTYDYNDYTFYIEANVQAIQTHNVNDAIGSLWGVTNVSAKNGKVTVK